MKKSVLFTVLLLLGLLLAAGGAVLGILLGETMKSLTGVMMGVGAGTFGLSAAQLTLIRYAKKHPEVQRQLEVDREDERRALIRWRAAADAGAVTQALLIAFAFATILLEQPLWLTFTLVGIYTLSFLLKALFSLRYEKRL